MASEAPGASASPAAGVAGCFSVAGASGIGALLAAELGGAAGAGRGAPVGDRGAVEGQRERGAGEEVVGDRAGRAAGAAALQRDVVGALACAEVGLPVA